MPKKTAAAHDLKSFRSLVSFRLHKLARLSDRAHERQYQQKFGLNLREYRIIGLTGALGEPSFRRICDESGLDKAHVSRLIDRLTQRGLLAKVQDPNDQRALKVRLTERGQAAHRALHAASTELNEQWLSALSATQRKAFVAALDALHERARELAEDREQTREKAAPRRTVTKKKAVPAAAAAKGEVVLNEKMASQLLNVLNAALRKRS